MMFVLRIIPTLRCNLSCEYCVNLHNKESFRGHEYNELKYTEWIYIINSLKLKTIITGGEPFLYPEIIDLLNNVKSAVVYTNLNWSEDLVDRIKNKKISFYASYHPIGKSFEYVIGLRKKLLAAGFSVNLHSIEQAGLTQNIKKDRDQRRLYECCSKKFKKRVICSNKHLLVAPDGVRYQCMHDLVSKQYGRENLTIEDYSGPIISRECEDYGYCSPCDGLIDSKRKEI